MPKDSVEVVNLETNDANRAVTNDSGYYAMLRLSPFTRESACNSAPKHSTG